MEIESTSAWVEIDGQKLPMYDIKRADVAYDYGLEPTVTCWIPSEAGKPLTAAWSAKGVAFHTGVFVHVDGFPCRGFTADPSQKIGRISHAYVAPNDWRLLLFSDTVLVDDNTLLEKPVSKDMGEIRLTLYEISVLTPFEGWYANWEVVAAPDGIMHERSKNALWHCAKLAANEQAPNTPQYRAHPNRKIGTFIFRYRPIEVLRTNGIAPRAPNKWLIIEEYEIMNVEGGDEDEDELDCLNQEIARLQARRENLWQHRGQKRAKVEERVKQKGKSKRKLK